jgi:hypothetical protein
MLVCFDVISNNAHCSACDHENDHPGAVARAHICGRRPSVVPPTNQDAKSEKKTHGITIRAIIGRTSIDSVFRLLCTNSGVIIMKVDALQPMLVPHISRWSLSITTICAQGNALLTQSLHRHRADDTRSGDAFNWVRRATAVNDDHPVRYRVNTDNTTKPSADTRILILLRLGMNTPPIHRILRMITWSLALSVELRRDLTASIETAGASFP